MLSRLADAHHRETSFATPAIGDGYPSKVTVVIIENIAIELLGLLSPMTDIFPVLLILALIIAFIVIVMLIVMVES